MANWKCVAQIWAERGANFELPRSILTEAGAEIEEEGNSLIAIYQAEGSADDAAKLMTELFSRCYVVIQWGAVSPRKFAWGAWGDGGSEEADSNTLPKDKKEAWERVNSEVWNATVTSALIGEEYAS